MLLLFLSGFCLIFRQLKPNFLKHFFIDIDLVQCINTCRTSVHWVSLKLYSVLLLFLSGFCWIFRQLKPSFRCHIEWPGQVLRAMRRADDVSPARQRRSVRSRGPYGAFFFVVFVSVLCFVFLERKRILLAPDSLLPASFDKRPIAWPKHCH